MRFVMRMWLVLAVLAAVGLAQQSSPPPDPSSSQSSSGSTSSNSSSNQPRQPAASQASPPPNQAPPRSKEEEKAEQEKSRQRGAEAGESSSRDTQIDTSPPKDDAKKHPNSGVGLDTNPEDDTGDVQEVHPWNPYRAIKDDEVADYYYKTKDYKAALARYQDALIYKPNDAVANFRMAQCYEKLRQPDEAIPHYQEYLKILPQGPYSKEARKALAKLGAPEKPTTEKASVK